MLRRRDTILILVLAILIALLAWAFLTGGKSNAPEVGSVAPPAGPSLPEGRIYFSAGGNIYAVRPDGLALTKIVDGERARVGSLDDHGRWASSPAVSPDGHTLAFVRGFDVWLSGLDGSDQRLAVDLPNPVGDPCCASSWGVGANSVAWSPDGAHLAYVASRVAGSGITQVYVANADGSASTDVSGVIGTFMVATWMDNDSVLLSPDGLPPNGVKLVVYSVSRSAKLAVVQPGDDPYISAHPLNGGTLATSFMADKDIESVSASGAITKLAIGVAAMPSPEGNWVAYFEGEALRLVSLEGPIDRLVLDLTPIGGRDHHFADTSCYPGTPPPADPLSYSYRPPVLSWGP